MLQRCSDVEVICIVSPVTRCSTTVASNVTTSVFFKEARATQARESRKSPASTATCKTNEKEKIKNKKTLGYNPLQFYYSKQCIKVT